jgi:tetratricopeptide (TPR) repeat protein
LAETAAGKAVAVIRQIPPNEINLLELPTRRELVGRVLHIYQAMGAKTLAAQTLRDAVAAVSDLLTPGGRSDEYACLFSAALTLDDRGVQASIRRRIDELEPVVDGGDRDHQPRVRGFLALCRAYQRAGNLSRAESALRDAHEILARADWGNAHAQQLKARCIELFATMVDWRDLPEAVARSVGFGLCEIAVDIGEPESLGSLAWEQATRADGLARETLTTYWRHTSSLASAGNLIAQQLRPRPSGPQPGDQVLSATIVLEAARNPGLLPEMLSILAQHEPDTEMASLARLAKAFSSQTDSRALRAVTAVIEKRILHSREDISIDIEKLVQMAIACRPASTRVSSGLLHEAVRRSSMVPELNLVTETLARGAPRLLAVAAPGIKARAPALAGSASYAIEELVAAATSIAPKVAADIGAEALQAFPKAARLQWVTARALACARRRRDAVALVGRALASSAHLDAVDDRLEAIEALIRALAACGGHGKAVALGDAGLALIGAQMFASEDDGSSMVKLSAPFVATVLALPGAPNLAAVEALARGAGHPRWRAQILLECAQAYANAGDLDKAQSELQTYLKLRGLARHVGEVSVRFIEVAKSAGWPGVEDSFAEEILRESKSGRYFGGGDVAIALVSLFDRTGNTRGLEILAEVQQNLASENSYPSAELALCLGGAAAWTAARRIPLLDEAVKFFLELSSSEVEIGQAAEGIRRLHVLGAVDLACERARNLTRSAATLAHHGGLMAAGHRSDDFNRAAGLVVAAELLSQLGEEAEARDALLRAEHTAHDIQPDKEKAEIVANLLSGHIALRNREQIRHYLNEKMSDPMTSAGDLAELLVKARLEDELGLLLQRARLVAGHFERTAALGAIAPAFLKTSAPGKAVIVVRDALGGAYAAGAPFNRLVLFRLLVKAAKVYQQLRDEGTLASLADVVLEEDVWWPDAARGL